MVVVISYMEFCVCFLFFRVLNVIYLKFYVLKGRLFVCYNYYFVCFGRGRFFNLYFDKCGYFFGCIDYRDCVDVYYCLFNIK